MFKNSLESTQENISFPQTAPIYDSSRRGVVVFEEFKEVLRYHELIYQLVRRDIVARYKRSVLGIAWTMLNPLGMMLILTIVFSQIFKSVEGYPVFVLTGIIIWTFFAQTTSAIITAFVWGADFFQRIYLPKSAFAIAAIGTGLVNLLLSLVPLLLVMIFIRFPIHPTIIFEPIPIILFALYALGIGLFISSIAVNFPDVAEMYQIVLMAWMYLSGVFYPLDILPEKVGKFVALNPMLPMIELFRLPIYYGEIPTTADLIPALVITLIAILVGWWTFAKKSDEFAYRT
jgi:ABC-2 type transport system permease protein